MKILLVFALSICIFSTQALQALDFDEDVNDIEDYGIITNGVQNIIESMIKLAEDASRGILNSLKNVIDNLEQSLDKLLRRSQVAINGMTGKVNEILEESAKERGSVQECLDKFRPIIQDARMRAIQEVKKCFGGAQQKAAILKNNVQQHINVIHGYAEESRKIVNNCFEAENNILTAAECVIDKRDELKSKIHESVTEAKKALADAKLEAKEISVDIFNCLKNVVKNLENELAAIVEDINKCLEE